VYRVSFASLHFDPLASRIDDYATPSNRLGPLPPEAIGFVAVDPTKAPTLRRGNHVPDVRKGLAGLGDFTIEPDLP
jgi:hypothetical protein